MGGFHKALIFFMKFALSRFSTEGSHITLRIADGYVLDLFEHVILESEPLLMDGANEEHLEGETLEFAILNQLGYMG